MWSYVTKGDQNKPKIVGRERSKGTETQLQLFLKIRVQTLTEKQYPDSDNYLDNSKTVDVVGNNLQFVK